MRGEQEARSKASRRMGKALSIVVPDYALRKGRVIVQVDKGLADAYPADAATQGGGDNLVSGRAGVASYIHGQPFRVCPVPAPALALVPLLGTVGGGQHQRYASRLPYLVQEIEEARVHLLDGAGRRTTEELRRGEVLPHRPGPPSSAPW